MPTAQRFDAEGGLRVLARPVTFRELAADAFDEIRIYGANNPDVLRSLLLAIREIAPGLRRAMDRDVLLGHVRNVVADSERINNVHDRQEIVASGGGDGAAAQRGAGRGLERLKHPALRRGRSVGSRRPPRAGRLTDTS